MSHNSSDPAFNTQFRRNWDGSPTGIKFLAELSEKDLDHVALAHGARFLRRLPAAMLADLQPAERRDLALAFGRPWLRRMQERRGSNGG